MPLSQIVTPQGIGAVPVDCGHGNMGSVCWARSVLASAVAAGALIAGANLTPGGMQSGGQSAWAGSTLTGTWRCLGHSLGDATYTGLSLWQRVA